MERNSEKQPETFCKFCKKFIVTKNFLLHQGRCQRQQELRSSRISNQSNQSSSKKYQNQSYSQKQSFTNRNRIFNTQEKKRLSNQNQFKKQKPINKQETQKIPCHFCGYLQTMQQLDSHPNQCEHWEIQCEFCQSKFPKSLMDQHKAICSQNPIIRRRNQQLEQRHHHRQFQSQQQSQYQNNSPIPMIYRRRQREMYQPSSLMDMFFGRQFIRHRHQNQQQGSQPSFNILHIQGSNGPRIIIRGNSSNPQNFIRLIQMLANAHNPNQNPGLTENQLAKLKRIKYLKKNPQADTCTICFCEFEENQQLIQLNCKHMFHQQCIFEWLKRVSTCPNCKKTVTQQKNSERIQPQNSQRGSSNRSNNILFRNFF